MKFTFMKLVGLACTILALSSVFALKSPLIISEGSSVMGIFEGSTLCGEVIRPIHKIPRQADCALVEWKLTLYHDPATLQPTTYKLTGVYRFVVKETNMYSKPGIKTQTEGKWIIVNGTKTNPGATVYQLDPDKAITSTRFMKLGDHLLHLLDPEGRLMIGDGAASYTLNRVSK